MLASFWKTLVFLAALPLKNVSAQQYMGDVIPNATYPSVPGSEIVYFRVKDPAGVNNNLTLVNYQSFGSNGKRIDPTKVKRAVIIIHGLNRDAGTYMSNMLSALSQVTGDSNINFDSVVINAPSFPNGDDKNVSYPYWDYPPGAKKKASGGNQSWTNLLVWKGSQWAGGGTNQYPNKAQSVSSYEVLDQLIAWYANKNNFPNINQVVIAGHSLGGQTVQRYAAVGKPLSTIGAAVPVTYWIANPNSLVWLNSSRPLSTASCDGYDDWREGLSNYTGYPSVYNTGLVASGDAAVLANYQSKSKAYARGTLDMGDDSSTCAPFTTGSNRHERFYYFINWWTPTCEAPSTASGHCDTVDLIPMGHDGGGMMASTAGRARLFSDNFYGDGVKSYDFGYPRIQSNVDDPYPNPAYNSSSTSANPGVFANNMTYAGCYTDSSIRTLAHMLYDSQSNTVEMCTSGCANAGYAIAGMEYGSQCWCDNTIGPYTEKVLDLGCSTPCPGNSTENCGQSNRLQLYSNSTLVETAAPSNPEVAGNYYYAGCHNESTNGHALSATSYSDGKNMTLENCAAFCNGYKYFGIEYAAECYCGSYFGVGSAIASDSSCAMTCTGNSLELCGGPGALSVYELSSDANVTTITQGSTTAGTSPTNTGTVSSLPSSSLCPATNGQSIADSNNITYTIACSSDTSVGSYSSAQASGSYFDCMVACDNAASSGCVAFTYVGGALGSGSGTCYLKNSVGSFTASGNNLVSGSRNSTGSTGALATSTSSGSSSGTSATGLASSSLCPATNGQNVADSNNVTYTVACSSDTSIGSYSSTQASSSYFDCMVACDNAASTGCVAFTYVGGALGSGSGTCYLKNSVGSFTGAANNLVSGSRVSSGSTSGAVTSTTSSAASAATTYANGATPSVNGVTFAIEVNVTYSGQTLALTKKRAAAVVGDCLNTCSQSTSCVGTAFDGSVCTYFGSIDNSSRVSAPGTTFATVEARSTATSTSSSSTGVPSASLCPSANGQTVNGYVVSCSSDTNIGSYSSANAVNSYLDCMSACNAAASTGCVAFTYVGGNNGVGSGACYLKNSKGSFTTAGGPNYIAGMIASQASSSSSSSSSSVSSTQSGSASSSAAGSTSSTATSSSATASASSSLCPSVDSQNITDSNGQVYTIRCQSDTNVGSFANAQAANTYADCMTACDSTTGCVAFTYVGGAQGQGSGTCWMKNSRGSATSAGGNNYIAGFLKQSTSSSTSSASSSSAFSSTVSSTTVSSSATASSSASASLCPQANGQIVTDANGKTYNVTCSSDNNVGSYSNTQASSSYLDCMTACDAASSSGCQGFTYVGGANGAGSGTCWLKQSMGAYIASGNNYISAVLVVNSNSNVVSLSSSSSSVSSSTGSSSSTSSVSPTSSSVSSSSSSTSSSSSSSSTVSSSSSSVSSSTSSSSSSSVTSSSSSSSTSSSSTVSSSSSSSTVSSSSSSSASSSSSSMATTLSTSTASASASSSTALSLPTGFSSYGCFIDGSTRALPYNAYSRSDNTPYKCASTCQSLGYKYAGTEYGSECWCSNSAPTSSTKATDCNMACSGDSTQTCGAGNRLSVYVNNAWVSTFNARTSYGTWNLMACYTDNTNGRVLPNTMSMTGGASNATIANCLDACARSGLSVCGAEYYQECYGGSVAPSSSLIAGSDPLAAGCNYPCSGNKTEACGGSNKILVYVNNGTASAARRRW
ncbi:hypothetical protein QM012_005002 [Aureobasidium pullulans]|uniref:WSC domain-containing protein n=1 Tax=Aureobasidium pullulans TaxID=5580 RepID=A0ABR0T639_AURPU